MFTCLFCIKRYFVFFVTFFRFYLHPIVCRYILQPLQCVARSTLMSRSFKLGQKKLIMERPKVSAGWRGWTYEYFWAPRSISTVNRTVCLSFQIRTILFVYFAFHLKMVQIAEDNFSMKICDNFKVLRIKLENTCHCSQ